MTRRTMTRADWLAIALVLRNIRQRRAAELARQQQQAEDDATGDGQDGAQ